MGAVQVTEELTRKVAQLARLELTDEEVRTFTRQLADILGYVDQLQKVDVADVEPLTHPLGLTVPMRDDVHVSSPVDAQGRPKTLGPAPEVVENGFKVPPIL